MGIDKKQLLKIKNIDFWGTVSKMSDPAYDEYCAKLEEFIEHFPVQEAEIRKLFKENDIPVLSNVLSEVRVVLSDIHAGELVKKCDKLSEDIKNINRDMAETSMNYFLTSVSMLSIEIQMAKYKVEEAPPPESTAALPPEAGIITKQKNVLAVDDVSLILNMLRGMLQNTEYRFTGVTSGAAALKFIENHEADLFLLDIEMPGMNGYELAEKLREMGKTAPILFLTGNAQCDYVMKAILMGAADFIVKPASQEQVLEKIRKHIR